LNRRELLKFGLALTGAALLPVPRLKRFFNTKVHHSVGVDLAEGASVGACVTVMKVSSEEWLIYGDTDAITGIS